MNQAALEWLNTVLPAEFRIDQPGQVKVLAGGSDRVFIRVPGRDRSVVILHATGAEDEFDQYLAIQQYLAKHRLGVPGIYFADAANKVAVLEDLGNDSLESAARSAKGNALTGLYRQVIGFLVDFQVRGFTHRAQCPVIDSRSFDHTTLRWETWYFRVYFLEQYCGLDQALTQGLTGEFEELASGLAGEKQLLIHRDFQSQNIFFTDGKVRIVDFQAAQKGVPAYDLVSLIRDPYMALPYEIGTALLDHYRQHLAEKGRITFKDDHWQELVTGVSLQRLLQALGAYSFLSLIKGRNEYRQFISPALSFLKKTLGQQTGLPELSRIIRKGVTTAIG